MGEPARLQLKVRHYEVDQYGHVNHAQYVHYLEVARIEALETLGLSLPDMRRQGYLILAADLSVKYLAPAPAPCAPPGSPPRRRGSTASGPGITCGIPTRSRAPACRRRGPS